MESGQLPRALGRELPAPLDLLRRKLAQILIDDIANVLEVDGEGHDLHRATAFTIVEAAARELGEIELDRFVQPIDTWSMRCTSATSSRSLLMIAVMT